MYKSPIFRVHVCSDHLHILTFFFWNLQKVIFEELKPSAGQNINGFSGAVIQHHEDIL